MIVRTIGTTLRQILSRNYGRFVTPLVRIYIRTFVSSRHHYTQGYIHVVKKDVQFVTPVAFRNIKGSELVQRLTSAAFGVISKHCTFQEWYAFQWECLYKAIVTLIESGHAPLSDTDDSLGYESVGIDSYVIEDKIGDISTCAAVYRALRGDTPVALKAMFNFIYQSQDEMLRFDNFGAELLTFSSGLPQHPNIIRINTHFVSANLPLSLSAGTEYPAAFELGREDTLFIEMPLYTSSLKEYLTSHTLTEEEAIWVLFQLSCAVHHIHSHDIVHRDIKLDNILVKHHPSGCLSVVLTDFGMAHDSLRTEDHPRGRKWGNPMLMPPEIALSRSPSLPLDYSSSDVWCVGSLVYELLGAQNPFSSQSSSTYTSLPPLPTHNQTLSLLTANLLSRDPHVRLTPAECLLACGTLLWLPHIFQIKLSTETIAKEFALVTWQMFHNSAGSAGEMACDPYAEGFVEFVHLSTPRSITRVVNKFVL